MGDCGSVSDQLKAAFALATKCYQHQLDDSVSIGEIHRAMTSASLLILRGLFSVYCILEMILQEQRSLLPKLIHLLVESAKVENPGPEKSKKVKSNDHNVKGGCRVERIHW